MPMIVLYSCPEDTDEVLYQENVEPISPTGVLRRLTSLAETLCPIALAMVPQRPATCPKCKKAYYKWECTTKSLTQG